MVTLLTTLFYGWSITLSDRIYLFPMSFPVSTAGYAQTETQGCVVLQFDQTDLGKAHETKLTHDIELMIDS